MDTMKVSVVIPVYNEQESIGVCLEHLVKQSYKDVEIIVVDDGSTDGSIEIIKKYPVQLLRQKHKGPGAARNLGVSKAKGDIAVFVDSDECCTRDYIKNLIKPILEKKAIGSISSAIHISNIDNKWAKCWSISHGLKEQDLSMRVAENDIYRAVLKSKFLEVGGFDEKAGYSDDKLFKKLGVKSYVVDNAKFYHKYPSTLEDVYEHAMWIGKDEESRKHAFVNVVAHVLPVSLLRGFVRACKYKEWNYVVFKIVFDFGLMMGIVKAVVFRDYSR
jgi:glycosyltransferase involved in cell wall biosynthesis